MKLKIFIFVTAIAIGTGLYAQNLTFTVKDVTFTMVKVKGGTFMMGATNEQGTLAHEGEKPVHKVTLSDYYIGETEVTQELWEAVMGNNPSNFKNPQNPVERVYYDDIVNEFIPELNRLTGKHFSLPTEAEWEFAARGGNKSKGYKYSGSNKIDDVAWYHDDYNVYIYETHMVKSKQPNELGIYDMSGNVNEWCYGWYGDYNNTPKVNPKGPSKGSYRVIRGGSWIDYSRYCRVSYRFSTTPDDHNDATGFRLRLGAK